MAIGSSELQRAVRQNSSQDRFIAETKLRNFGVSDRQIAEIAASDRAVQNIRVYAPQDGVVTHLAAADGMFLRPDVQALSISEVSSVWLIVDVFERDIGRTSTDMTAQARFDHLPGRVFEGDVDYIYPELDAITRTLPVRLRFGNQDLALRPNMFGRVTLEPNTTRQAVTVPSEAVIRTGHADRVIVSTGEGTFKPRYVTIGLRDDFGAGGRTEILQGLAPGEEVVASAQFLIDSESVLNAGLQRFVPTSSAPVSAKGTLLAIDGAGRTATIAHGPIAALDWPGLETTFALDPGLDGGGLQNGEDVEFEAVLGGDGRLTLTVLARDDGIDATGTGIIHARTADGHLDLSHDPIPALGWPSMRMNLPTTVDRRDAVPLDTPVTFDLRQGDDGLYTVVAVRAIKDGGTGGATDPTAGLPGRAMQTSGIITGIDAVRRVATVTHGPLHEIGMPGMTMDFPLADTLDPADLPLGTAVRITVHQAPDMALTLFAVEASEGTAQ